MRLITRMFLVTGAMLCASIGQAEPPSANGDVLTMPTFHLGDSWLLETTSETGQSGFRQGRIMLVVRGLDSDTITVGIKPDGAPTAFEDHVVGTDWSQRRLMEGAEKPTTRPLRFPMKIGDSWSIDYLDATQRGTQRSDHVRRGYRVIGWQDITVPAGSFHAMVIDARGVDEIMVDIPSTAGSIVATTPNATRGIVQAQKGGTRLIRQVTHSQFFYVPEVRYWVKSIEERFNSDDVLMTRETRDLVKFTPGS